MFLEGWEGEVWIINPMLSFTQTEQFPGVCDTSIMVLQMKE